MKERHVELARRWLSKAQHDLIAARQILLLSEPPTDIVAFHAQQAVEKALKGWLMFKAIAFPHSHDLVRLLDLCLPDVCEIDVFRLKLARLSQFAVDARYPSESYEISREQAADALELAQKIVVLIEERLPESASDLP